MEVCGAAADLYTPPTHTEVQFGSADEKTAYIRLLLERGNQFFEQKDYAGAIRAFIIGAGHLAAGKDEEAENFKTLKIQLYLPLMMSYYKVRNTTQCIEMANMLITADPHDPNAYLLKGRSLAKTGDVREGLYFMLEAHRLRPTNMTIQRAIDDTRRRHMSRLTYMTFDVRSIYSKLPRQVAYGAYQRHMKLQHLEEVLYWYSDDARRMVLSRDLSPCFTKINDHFTVAQELRVKEDMQVVFKEMKMAVKWRYQRSCHRFSAEIERRLTLRAWRQHEVKYRSVIEDLREYHEREERRMVELYIAFLYIHPVFTPEDRRYQRVIDLQNKDAAVMELRRKTRKIPALGEEAEDWDDDEEEEVEEQEVVQEEVQEEVEEQQEEEVVLEEADVEVITKNDGVQEKEVTTETTKDEGHLDMKDAHLDMKDASLDDTNDVTHDDVKTSCFGAMFRRLRKSVGRLFRRSRHGRAKKY